MKHLSNYVITQIWVFVMLTTGVVSVYGQQAPKIQKYKDALSEKSINVESKSMMMSYLYRINAGGWQTGDGWEKDTQSDPSGYVNSAQIGFLSSNGAGGGWGGIYSQKSRVNMSPNDMEWDFPVANGDYIVNLYFAENSSTYQTIGSRVFDVEIEGQKALEDFDILKHTGTGFVIRLPFYVAVSDGNIDIDFITEVGSSLITGIEIEAGSSINYPISSFNTYGLNFTMREGEELRVPFIFSDLDSDLSALDIFGEFYNGDVSSFTIVDNGDGSGELVFLADFADAGVHDFIFGAEDENGGVTDCPACWAAGTLTVLNTDIGEPVYRVNAGDWMDVSDGAVSWVKDTYSFPSTYVNSTDIGFASASHSILSNATDAPNSIYYKSRVDNSLNDMLWQFPVPNGTYTVKLYFVESNFNLTGERVFDVKIEGSTVLSYFDILSETTKNVPVQKDFTAVVSDGNLSIEFDDRMANPIIAGIEIAYGVVPAPIAPELPIDVLAANEQLTQKVSVFPNPIEDEFTVELKQPVKGNIGVRLIDMDNQVRYQGITTSDVSRASSKFIIGNLPSGIYQMEVSDGHSRYYQRVIIK